MSASASSPKRSPPAQECRGCQGSNSRSGANWRYFLLGGSVPPLRRRALSDSPEEDRRLADAYAGRARCCRAAVLPLAGAGEDNAEANATKRPRSTWSRRGWLWLKSERESIMSNGASCLSLFGTDSVRFVVITIRCSEIGPLRGSGRGAALNVYGRIGSSA
jgi:hypothetical protein